MSAAYWGHARRHFTKTRVLRLLEHEHHPNARRVQEVANRYIVTGKFKTFPIYGWGFTIGATITKLYAERQAK
jgi:hypothetical protein